MQSKINFIKIQKQINKIKTDFRKRYKLYEYATYHPFDDEQPIKHRIKKCWKCGKVTHNLFKVVFRKRYHMVCESCYKKQLAKLKERKNAENKYSRNVKSKKK